MGGTIRTPRTRLLASLLAAILTLSLLTPAGWAAAENSVTGSVSATLRIDYEQSLEELRERNVQAEVLQGNTSLGVLHLYESGETTLGGYPAAVSHRGRDGGELGGGNWPGYLDLEVKGLPQGTYTLRFTGRGYVACEETVQMTDCAWHVIAGTGDATFTLGDVNSDGRVDEKDRAALTAALGSESPADVTAYDLSGDGRIDITDLAYVNRQLKAQGGAERLETTWLGVQVDAGATSADLAKQPLTVEGSLEDLFVDNGRAVTFRPDAGQTSMTIPLTLSRAMETEELQITCPTAGTPAAGTVEVEDEAGNVMRFSLPDGEAIPEGVHAIGRVEGKNVITINLGTRVAVKKVTITVTKLPEGGYAAVETIQFLKDIVPENPAPANTVVKGLTAVPGGESVSLSWNVLPNVSGYKVLYWPQSSPSAVQELHVDVTSAQVTGLENLKTYVFTVTPTDGDWEGKPSAPVTAMPMPSKVPDKTDMVSVTAMDGALRVSWKPGKSATYYEVYYCEKGTEQWQQAGGRLTDPSVTIDNLTNGVTYTLYVVAGNDIGLGPRSDIAEGTPEAVKIERPEGIPTEGLLDPSKIASVELADKNNYDKNSYTANKPFAPENVIDGDYATHWTASGWNTNEHIIVTFKEPVNLRAVIWVPRLDGTYPKQLRAYSVRVWYADGKEALLVPDPVRGGVDNGGTGADVHTWPNIPNLSTLAADRFAIMPFDPVENVVKISVAAEQNGYDPNRSSLSELLFMEYDPSKNLTDDIANLFQGGKTGLHTQLIPGVTSEQIQELKDRLTAESNYYFNVSTMADELKLAEELLANQTSSGVIIHGVDARKADSSASSSDLQPLGVTAKAGDEITIYAQGIPEGQSLTIYATQFNSEVSGWRGSVGTLVNGRNVLKVPQLSSTSGVDHGGSLYLTYSGSAPESISLHVRRAIDIPALDLSDWYDMDESARRETIGSYIDELSNYLVKYTIAKDTGDYRNVTEITTPVMLLSLPAKAVNGALGGDTREAKIETIYNDVLAWEDVMHICKTTHGIDGTYQNNNLTGRQNIRCMTMFAGAFMYAAGNHVGIGYGSCGGMVVGKPIPQMNGDANRLFGWGIAHEIGHNMDRLGKAEITNNIYSLMVQTYDGANNTLASRLEKSGKYQRIFSKVAQGYPGASGDVFTQLGMYWQLHLAYDEGQNDTQHGPMWFFNQFSKDWAAGTYTAGESSYDDKVALTAAGVVGKNLTEFFTRWGMVLSESTKTQLASYGQEPRAIWYLSDQSRRDRLAGVSPASGQITATAVSKTGEGGKNNVIEVTIDASGLTGSVQGYEILRNGKSIDFVMAGQNSYTDTIGSGNHRTYEYQVVAYDTLGNQIGEATEKQQVRVAYDMVVDRSAYDIQRDENNNVVITMKAETAVSGLKLSGISPESGSFTVTVTGTATGEEGQVAEQNWTALTGDFSNNQATDDPSSFVAYFKVPGAAGDDTRIWTYDAKTVTITGIPDDTDLEKVQLISYAGDDISFWEGATMGLLANDLDYGTGVIKAGTLVIVGTFRGDPVYNTVMVNGEFAGTATSDDNELAPVEYERRPINGESILFATVPAFGEMCDISDGFFIFVPDVQREAEIQDNKDASHCTMTNLLPSRIQATLYRTDDPDNASSKRTTAQTMWISCPGGTEEELPKVVITSDGGAAQ